MNLAEDNLANIGERRPRGDAWARSIEVCPMASPDTYAISVWTRGRYHVRSELCVAELPGGGVGPQWVITIRRIGRRSANTEECRRILRAFGIGEAKKHNGEPGQVRKFSLPLAVSERGIVFEHRGPIHGGGAAKIHAESWDDVGGVRSTPSSVVVAGGTTRHRGPRIGG